MRNGSSEDCSFRIPGIRYVYLCIFVPYTLPYHHEAGAKGGCDFIPSRAFESPHVDLGILLPHSGSSYLSWLRSASRFPVVCRGPRLLRPQPPFVSLPSPFSICIIRLSFVRSRHKSLYNRTKPFRCMCFYPLNLWHCIEPQFQPSGTLSTRISRFHTSRLYGLRSRWDIEVFDHTLLAPRISRSSIPMDLSVLSKALKQVDWNITDESAVIIFVDEGSQHSEPPRSRGTPICDLLVSRGVLPDRKSRPWGNDCQPEAAPSFKTCLQSGIHEASSFVKHGGCGNGGNHAHGGHGTG